MNNMMNNLNVFFSSNILRLQIAVCLGVAEKQEISKSTNLPIDFFDDCTPENLYRFVSRHVLEYDYDDLYRFSHSYFTPEQRETIDGIVAKFKRESLKAININDLIDQLTDYDINCLFHVATRIDYLEKQIKIAQQELL